MSLTFRLCTLTTPEKSAVTSFLNANWDGKHPLVHCADFFAYYYADEINNTLQFAFAEENGIPVALAGYIRANQSATPDIWVSIWCAVKGKNGVGLELMAALPTLTHARVMACNNIRPKTMAFYTFLGYTAARLPHFYRLATKKKYTVARVTHLPVLPASFSSVQNTQKTLVLLDESALLRGYMPDASLSPHKDLWYLTRRYFHYPRQSYDVYGITDTDAYDKRDAACEARFSALLVTRTVPVDGVNVLRIVDYIGAPETFAVLGQAIGNLMEIRGAEYADCYCYGVSPQIFAQAGFSERTPKDTNIIPNYLNPPLYENTEYYFFTSHPDGFTMWKADGDQDRPNVVFV